MWDENWSAIQLFSRFNTQWRVGMAGPVGLDYSVIQADREVARLSDSDLADLMDRLRVIEFAALEFFNRS